MNISQQRVAVLGCGRSGIAAAKLALAKGAGEVCIFDTSPKAHCCLPEINSVPAATEQDAANFAADLVIISPGVDNFEWAHSFCAPKNAPLMGETEFAYRNFKGKIIAITGTNGKTTTTALIEHVLKHVGKSAIACGNYGLPLSEVILDYKGTEYAVLEVSSFQMEAIEKFCPDVAIWLNFAPDHMDRYSRLQDYFDAKRRIFENMSEEQLAIIRTDENLPDIRAREESFSSESEASTLYYRDGFIYEGDKPIINMKNTRMKQAHNAENTMAAYLACRPYGVSADDVAESLSSFIPPCHRCELVACIDDITWLNDSKSTNLHSTATAIRSQTQPIVLIVGGKDKGLNYKPLLPLLEKKARCCLCFGQIGAQLSECLAEACPTEQFESVTDCVARAVALAKAGDVVLFSPGTSSFDQFSGYEERGQCFRDAVLNNLPI